jgi:hypothetical protein
MRDGSGRRACALRFARVPLNVGDRIAWVPMTGPGCKLRSLVFAIVVLLVVAAQARADATFTPDIEQPAASEVKAGVDASERPASLDSGIPIHTNRTAAMADALPVYSVHLDGTGSTSEHVRISTRVFSSYCIGTDINGSASSWPCTQLANDGKPNPQYDIHLQVLVYKGTAPDDTITSTSDPFIDKYAETCFPDKHHCTVTLSTDTSICGSCKKYVNAEVIAWTDDTQNWHGGDLLALEGDCSSGGYNNCTPVPNCDPANPTICQTKSTKGEMGLVRLGSSYSATVPNNSGQFLNTQIPIGKGACNQCDPVIIYRKPLYNLHADDVIETSAQMHAAANDYPNGTNGLPPFYHYVGTWWILASSPTETGLVSGTASPKAFSGAGPQRWVSGWKGTNCVLGSVSAGEDLGECNPDQVGVVVVPDNPPPTMYLNEVGMAAIQNASNTNSTHVNLSSGNFLINCNPEPNDPLPDCSF